jgi:hypothetical protein
MQTEEMGVLLLTGGFGSNSIPQSGTVGVYTPGFSFTSPSVNIPGLEEESLLAGTRFRDQLHPDPQDEELKDCAI